jgi:hypothetical protein
MTSLPVSVVEHRHVELAEAVGLGDQVDPDDPVVPDLELERDTRPTPGRSSPRSHSLDMFHRGESNTTGWM